MIEGAVVHLPGRTVKTRLHEHGVGEGYFDGKYEDMKALVESDLHCVDIWVGDKLKTVLVDVVWGPLDDQRYGNHDHAIVHVNWKDDSEDGEWVSRRRRLQEKIANVGNGNGKVPGLQVDQDQTR